MNVPDAERVRELPAADLTSVRRLDLHAVLQPFVGDALVIDGDLEGDGVSLLSVQVLQHGGDQDGWRGKYRSGETFLKKFTKLTFGDRKTEEAVFTTQLTTKNESDLLLNITSFIKFLWEFSFELCALHLVESVILKLKQSSLKLHGSRPTM